MKTVLCHGCFDVLHAGHLKHFEAAKKYGDRLIVSITSDRFVNKGPGRPYFTSERRAAMVGALRCVDEVIISDEPTALGVIHSVKPDFYVKGQDYQDATKDVTGEIENEKKAVESYGGQLIFTQEETFSSSKIINQSFERFTDDQTNQIESIKAIGGVQSIEEAINNLSKLRVLVIGEPILDVYRFVNPEGISSKSPTVSCRLLNEEKYYGGAWAIESHLKSFCDVDYLDVTPDIPVKIRYISGTQRVFEVTEIHEEKCRLEVEIPTGYDVYVVADFGHGMFKGGELDEVKGYIGLNVQTNSSNYGYNVYTKHRRFDYLCLDTREGRLATHDRFTAPLGVAQKIRDATQRPLGFTVGANGAYLLDGRDVYYSPTYADTVVDATGAGDAYFAITTLLMASGCKRELIPFIGCVFAGLKTRIIGNKSAVSKASLLKAIKGILA